MSMALTVKVVPLSDVSVPIANFEPLEFNFNEPFLADTVPVAVVASTLLAAPVNVKTNSTSSLAAPEVRDTVPLCSPAVMPFQPASSEIVKAEAA